VTLLASWDITIVTVSCKIETSHHSRADKTCVSRPNIRGKTPRTSLIWSGRRYAKVFYPTSGLANVRACKPEIATSERAEGKSLEKKSSFESRNQRAGGCYQGGSRAEKVHGPCVALRAS
jgi:hypothetical protein